MFRFCPSCASDRIAFDDGRVFRCPACGFTYYHNTAAATGCVISVPDEQGPGRRILFLIRGKEPSKGKLDLPGGFVDPGEGALEGLHRELREELGWTPPVPPGIPLTAVYSLFASFPNRYPYKGIPYNTCDLYFTLEAPSLSPADLVPAPGEIAGIRFLAPGEIDFDQIAFESTRNAVRAYLAFGKSRVQ